jgi:hypothetical protein
VSALPDHRELPHTTGVQRCGDFCFEVRSGTEELHTLSERLCNEFSHEPSGAVAHTTFAMTFNPGGANSAPQDDRSPSHAPTAMAMASTFGARLTRALLDTETDKLHLHAAAVERDQSAVLLLGASGSGKSTLSAHLTSRGYRYLSDEMVALTETAGLVPYPKAISLKGEALTLFADEAEAFLQTWHTNEMRVELPVDLFGSVTSFGEVPVGATVDLTFDATVDLEVGHVSPAVAVRTMIENSMDFRRSGPGGLLVLGAIAVAAPAFRVIYGSLESLELWLAELHHETLGRSPVTSVAALPLELVEPGTAAAPAGLQAHLLRIGEESVLYETENFGVAVLDHLGTNELLHGSRGSATAEVAEFYATLADLGMITASSE